MGKLKMGMAEKKKEQEERERATNDFCKMIDKQLEDMENKVVDKKQEDPTDTGAVPKQKQNKNKGKGKKSKSNTPNVLSPKVMSPEPAEIPKATKEDKKVAKNICNNEPAEKDKADIEKTEAQANTIEQIEKVNSGVDLSQSSSSNFTAEQIKATVDRIEGKVQSVRGNIADIALSEQYLRTKQALLMAKKKEQEKKIAKTLLISGKLRSSR